MEKIPAIIDFWNSFGIPAYDEQDVPEDAKYPYITYELAIGNFESEIALSAGLWYRSSNWEAISKKCDEISYKLHTMSPIKINNGYIRLWEGATPLFQRMAYENDDKVKRIVVNIMAEYMTNY